MKKKKRLVWPILAAVILFVNLILPYIGTFETVKAAEVNLKTLNFSQNVTLHSAGSAQPTSGNDISKEALNPQSGYELYTNTSFFVNYDYKIPDGANQISADNTYVIDTPENITAVNSEEKTLKDDKGKEIGTFSINNQKIYINFNSYFISQNNREFNIWHKAYLANDTVKGNTYPAVFDNGQTYYLKNIGPPSFPIKTHTVYKGGAVNLEDDGTFKISWSFYFSFENVMRIPAGTIIEDTMSANQILDKDSFKVSPEEFNDYLEVTEVTDTSFKIKVLKDITQQIRLDYNTLPIGDFDKNAWVNDFNYKGAKTVDGDPLTVGIGGAYKDSTIEDYSNTAIASYRTSSGGGGFGSLPSFTIQKVWEQGDTPPNEIKVMVLQNGQDYREVTLTKDNGWKETVTNYPVMDSTNTKDYTYTVKEIPIDGYNSNPKITGDDDTGFTITNEKVKNIKVKKEWLDDWDHGDLNVIVTGKVGTEEVSSQTIILDMWNGYKTTVENLPYFKDGKEINYTVKEDKVPDGYKEDVTGNEQDGFTITNTLMMDITLKKNWIDDGSSPDSVVVEVSNGKDPPIDVTLEKKDNYEAKINVPEFGKDKVVFKHKYTVKEKNLPAGYQSKVTGDENTGFIITNTKVKDIPVEKKWLANKGNTPDQVEVTLSGAGEQYDLTLEKENEYKGEFKNIPIFKDGEEIAYTLTEKPIEGYKTTIEEDNATGGFVVTNTEQTKIDLTKVWSGTGSHPDQVEISIINEKTKAVVETIELTKAQEFKATSKLLPAYDENGEKITYNVKETPIDQYKATVTGDMEKGFTITNTKEESLAIPVTKKWVDDKSTHEAISVELYGQDKTKPAQTVELNAANEFKATFTNMPIYTEDGQKVEYTVKEKNTPTGYVSKVTGDEEKGFVVTNTEQTKIDLTKVWSGTGSHPDQVEISIINEKTKAVVETIELTKAQEFKATSKLLPAYDENGEKITYNVKETPIDQYKATVTGDMEKGFTITNTKEESLAIPVTKKWVDDKSTHEAISVELYGQDKTKPAQTVELNAANEFKATFTNMPIYTEDGQKVEYTVKEKNTPTGYVSKVTGDEEKGFVVTNTEQTKIDLTKVWSGTGSHPDQVEISIINEKTKAVVETIELTKAQEFKATSKLLPAYDENGEKITYNVKETPIDQYKATVTGDMEKGFTITNTKEESLAIPVTKKWVDDKSTHEAISVELYGQDKTKPAQTVELNAANEFKATFTNMPVYTEDGQKVEYTVKEKNTPTGYVSKVTGDVEKGFVVTNTKQQTLNFTKKWLDGEKTHSDVTLHVKGSNGVVHDVVLNEKNKFKATLTVPQYDEKNKKITYTVEEQEVKGYISTITGDEEQGYTITNTKVFDLPIQKVWKDELDIHGEITVHVIGSDGTDREIKLNEENDFKTVVKNLPQYDEANKKITYKVKEEEVENYKATITGDEEKGYTITNTLVKKDDVPSIKNETPGGTGNNGKDGNNGKNNSITSDGIGNTTGNGTGTNMGTGMGTTPNTGTGTSTGSGTGSSTGTTPNTGKASDYSSSASPKTIPSNSTSDKVLPQTGMSDTNIILYSGIAVVILALSMFIYTLRKRKAA